MTVDGGGGGYYPLINPRWRPAPHVAMTDILPPSLPLEPTPADTHRHDRSLGTSACADACRRPPTRSTSLRARTRRLCEDVKHQGGQRGAGLVPVDTPAMLVATARRRAGHPTASACVDACRRLPTRSTPSWTRARRCPKDVEHKDEWRGAGVVPAGQQPSTPTNTIGVGAAPACTDTSRHDRRLREHALDAVEKT